jgi:hypothetical protein
MRIISIYTNSRLDFRNNGGFLGEARRKPGTNRHINGANQRRDEDSFQKRE